jgi:protein-tyrosine phosphatase
MNSEYAIFAGGADDRNAYAAGGMADLYKSAETLEKATEYFSEALFKDNHKWAHIASLKTLTIVKDSIHCDIEDLKQQYFAFKLPELEIQKSENWIKDSSTKFGRKKDALFIGPNIESNILIPNNILVVGGYPKAKELFKSLKDMGIDTYVCLNIEYGTTDRRQEYESYAETEISDATFIHAPIKDMNITDDHIITELCKDLKTRILGGSKIYLHCSGGHGRTGTVACVLLHMLYPELSNEQIFDYVQFSHDQRVGNYGYSKFNKYIYDKEFAECFQYGQVPSPQTSDQRYQVKRLILENKCYLEAKQNYDGDLYLQQEIGFEDWYESMKNFDAAEASIVEEAHI